jgi:hypothetical protein
MEDVKSDGMMELYERDTNMIPDMGCLCRLKVLLSGILCGGTETHGTLGQK